MPALDDSNAIYIGANSSTKVYIGATQVWPTGAPPATGPEVIQSTNGPNPGTTLIAATFAAGVQTGDIVFFYLTSSSQTQALRNPVPTGWVNVLGGLTAVASDAHWCAALYHIVTAGENGNTNFGDNFVSSVTTGNYLAATIRGVNLSSPVDNFGSVSNINAVTPHILAGITGTGGLLSANSLIMSGVSKDGTGTYTTPTGYTTRQTQNTSCATWLGTRDTLTTANTDVAPVNITPSASDEYTSISVAWAAPAAPFVVPTDLPNCVLWLDGDDDASFTYSSGSEVSQWGDRSGGARHVSQATVGKQPTRSANALNGKDIVIFTRANADCLRRAGTSFITGTTLTVFVVAYMDGAPAGNDRILGFNSQFDEDYQLTGAAAIYASGTGYPAAYRNADKSQASSFMHSQWLTITSIFDGINHTMKTGATAYTAVASTGSFAIQDINVACVKDGTQTGNVRIAEIIVYSDAKNTTDQTTVRSYLASKWGV